MHLRAFDVHVALGPANGCSKGLTLGTVTQDKCLVKEQTINGGKQQEQADLEQAVIASIGPTGEPVFFNFKFSIFIEK